MVTQSPARMVSVMAARVGVGVGVVGVKVTKVVLRGRVAEVQVATLLRVTLLSLRVVAVSRVAGIAGAVRRARVLGVGVAAV